MSLYPFFLSMALYEVGKTWWFKQLSGHAHPGDVIELEEAEAEQLMHNEPGLLKPVRKTAQAEVPAARTKKTATKTSRARR